MADAHDYINETKAEAFAHFYDVSSNNHNPKAKAIDLNRLGDKLTATR